MMQVPSNDSRKYFCQLKKNMSNKDHETCFIHLKYEKYIYTHLWICVCVCEFLWLCILDIAQLVLKHSLSKLLYQQLTFIRFIQLAPKLALTLVSHSTT